MIRLRILSGIVLVSALAAPAWAQNPYYDHGSFPAPGTTASSAAMRAELDLIEAGFAKLPTLTGNANKIVVINSSATALTSTDAPIPSVTAFPIAPSVGAIFIVTDDSAAGVCDSAGGTNVTLCRWNGSAWIPLGGGGGGGSWTDLLDSGAMPTSESSIFKIRGVGAQSGNGRNFYQHSNGTFFDVCVTAEVEGACNYIRKLAATYKLEVTNHLDAPIFTISNDTGALTNVTLNAESAGNVITLPFEWDLDLCAINPADSSLSHIWNKDTLSANPTLTAKTGTNRHTCVATFPDADGDHGVAITRRLPTGWTGSFDADIWWDTTGTGNARFQIATKCYADDAADDAAYNTASPVTAAAGTSGRPNLQALTGITTTGCAGGNLMRIRFFRNRTEGSDTLNAELNVEKVVLIGRAAR